MIDYSLWNTSSKISCDNMVCLAKKEGDENFNIFTKQFSLTCNNLKTEEDNDNENELLRGQSIHKKSCFYKRDIYNNGDWNNQFQDNLFINGFNTLTKKKGLTKY